MSAKCPAVDPSSAFHCCFAAGNSLLSMRIRRRISGFLSHSRSWQEDLLALLFIGFCLKEDYPSQSFIRRKTYEGRSMLGRTRNIQATVDSTVKPILTLIPASISSSLRGILNQRFRFFSHEFALLVLWLERWKQNKQPQTRLLLIVLRRQLMELWTIRNEQMLGPEM